MEHKSNSSFFSQPAKQLLSADFKLVSISASLAIAPALQTILTAGIYGAPVSKEGEDPKSQWIGFIELSDIVAFIVSLFHDGNTVSAKAISGHREYSDEQLNKINNVLNTTTIQEFLTQRTTHASTWSLDDTATIQNVIDALSSRSRVVLASKETGNIIGLLSRSALISYFAKNTDALAAAAPNIINQAIDEAHLVKKDKLIISRWGNEEERAIDAFAKMAESHISHLALVNDNSGSFDLVGNISLKDISTVFENGRAGGPVGVKVLLMPVGPYINHIRQQNLKAVHPAIHATVEGGDHGPHHEGGDTVGKCIVRLAATKIHRMYVTTDGAQGTPRALVGVLSLGDIVRLFKSK